ncbi:MAG TPA: PQQ-binding-like beta-propeller repeat protein [Planctomycetota bacterium]
MTFLAFLIVLQEWPQFRGPDGQGHAEVKTLPLKWSETSAAWKTPIPGLGWSSPVVADGQVWITTATDDGKSLRAVCVDATSGKLLKDVEVFKLPAAGRVHQKNSHASPTPILEDGLVYVHFGPHGTACLRTDGTVVWKQQIKYGPVHGPGGSPVLWKDLLVFSCDGGDVQFVIALDKKTGTQKWRTSRPPNDYAKKFAFSTPLVVDGLAISPGASAVTAYEANGKPVWTVRYAEGYSVVPRPVFGHGLIFIATGYDKPTLIAVRADGKGDVTDTHVAWKLERGAPHNPSPLLIGDELYIVSDNGVAACLDAKTGKEHWRERLGGNYSASPLHAAGRIYFQDENGLTTVVKPGRAFEKLASNQLPGRTLASPAAIEGALFLRTDKQLYRINAEP